MDQPQPSSLPKPSRILTGLGLLLRLLSPLPVGLTRRLLRPLGVLPGNPWVGVRVGAFSLTIDRRNSAHREMLPGIYERENVRALRAALRPGDVHVDVGAEIGYMAAQAASVVGASGRLVLFEPDPRIFPRLRAHMELAPRDRAPSMEIVQRACSDIEREFDIELAPPQRPVATYPVGAIRSGPTDGKSPFGDCRR